MIKFHIYQFTFPLIGCVTLHLFTLVTPCNNDAPKILNVQALKQKWLQRQRQRKEAEKRLLKISLLKKLPEKDNKKYPLMNVIVFTLHHRVL